MPPPATEQVTICTNALFTVHRNIQVWKKGSPLSVARFQGTYDRYGKGLNMTFNASDLARGGAFPDYVNQYLGGTTGTGKRLFGPFTIPGEKSGDGIGPIVPPAWSAESMADPDYNMVNNNCITTVADVLNKIRLRFIREGIPRDAVRIFRPWMVLQKNWLMPPPGVAAPPNVQADVKILKDVLNDPNLTPQQRAERQAEVNEAFGPDAFTVFYTPYRLDPAIQAALNVWQGWAGAVV